MNGPAEKREKRKQAKRDEQKIRYDLQYIAMAAKICKGMDIPYIVAASEADSQCRYVEIYGNSPSLIVTGDSDLVAYGNKVVVVVVVKSWRHEKFRVIDMREQSLLSQVSSEGVSHDSRVLCSLLIQQHASVVLHILAACFGCDFTPDESGLPGVGEKTIMTAFECFLDKEPHCALSLDSFAAALLAVEGQRLDLGRAQIVEYCTFKKRPSAFHLKLFTMIKTTMFARLMGRLCFLVQS